MTTRTLFLAASSLALAACVADPAKDAPKATVQTPAVVAPAVTAATPAVAAPAVAKTETLAIDAAASKISWTASKVTRTHPGGFKTFTGTIALGDGKPESSTVSIEIDMNSIYTNSDMLIGHLKSSDFFDVPNFPKSNFVSTAITAGGTDGATHTVKGNLTMHGVTKDISFPATITVTDKQVTAKAKFSFNRQDWKIAHKGAPDDLVRDDVLMELDVTANRS